MKNPSKKFKSVRDTKFNFVKNFKWFITASAAVLLAGIFVVIFAGFNLGLDFTGGTVLQIEFGRIGVNIDSSSAYNTNLDKIEDILKDNGLKVSSAQKEGSGADAGIVIKYQDIRGKNEEKMGAITLLVREQINEEYDVTGFVDVGDEYDITEGTERISASAKNSLLFNAIVAMLVSIALILVYIAFRFEPLSGISSILCLLHDILITLTFVAIFRIQMNTAFVAAIITIIGYSINNSIIIFDRVRENLKKPSLTDKTNKEIANISIKQSLLRTINTTATTLFAVVMLAVLGVASIREFILVIIIGIVAGTYSSVFLAAPFWAVANKERKLVKPKVYAEENPVDESAPVIEITDKQ